MAGSFQYNSVENAVAKLSKMQEYLDLGYSSALDIALDIEESKPPEESSAEVETLKEVTLRYVEMEKELTHWLEAAELTKAAFREEYGNVTDGTVPNIEDILLAKLNEIDKNDRDDIEEHAKAKEFVQQVWNVHHSGQPLPRATEESENLDSDIVIAQASEESMICPLTQKQMVEPVRSKQCHHSYEKGAIIHHIQARHRRVRCPVAGCAHFVTEADLEPNTSLAFRIKRLQRKQ